MKRLGTFFLGIVVGALLFYAATSYHLVRAQDGFHFIPKLDSRITEAYVDIRGWGPAEWLQHGELAMAIEKAGRRDLLNSAMNDALNTGLDRVFGPSK